MREDVHEAGHHLAELVAAAEAGQDVVLTVDGHPAVRLVPITPTPRPVQLGVVQGSIQLGEAFDEPLPEFEPYVA